MDQYEKCLFPWHLQQVKQAPKAFKTKHNYKYVNKLLKSIAVCLIALSNEWATRIDCSTWSLLVNECDINKLEDWNTEQDAIKTTQTSAQFQCKSCHVSLTTQKKGLSNAAPLFEKNRIELP